MNRWDALSQKAPHPSLTKVPVETATNSYNGEHSGRTKLIATHQKQTNKRNMPFCHLHIKGSTRLTERKITFSGSYYAEIIFMAKLGINAFLRPIPTFVNTDNLRVAIRGKRIRCLLQTCPPGSEQKVKASSERQPAGRRRPTDAGHRASHTDASRGLCACCWGPLHKGTWLFWIVIFSESLESFLIPWANFSPWEKIPESEYAFSMTFFYISN